MPYLVMEYIDGATLQDQLDSMGPIDSAEVVRVGRQIALGLAAAHARGLIHRDIKPVNILLEKGGETRAGRDLGGRGGENANRRSSAGRLSEGLEF